MFFVLLIWPTPYVYRSQKTEWGNLIRVNRITQSVCVLHKGEWVSLRQLEQGESEEDRKQREAEDRRREAEDKRREAEDKRRDEARVVPDAELQKIKLEPTKLWGDKNYYVDFKVYNGTARPLGEILLVLHDNTPGRIQTYEQEAFCEFDYGRTPVPPRSWADDRALLDVRPRDLPQKYWVTVKAARRADDVK